MKDITILLIYLLPGFISLEISRLLIPEYYKKKAEEKVISLIIFSFVNYLFYFILSPLSVYDGFKRLLGIELFLLPEGFALLLLISIATGIIWGLISQRAMRAFYDITTGIQLKKDGQAYKGGAPFFEQILEEYNHYWCEVELVNGDIYLGCITNRALPPDPPAIVLKKVLQNRGGEELYLEEIVEATYIDYNKINTIKFMKPEKTETEKENPIQDMDGDK